MHCASNDNICEQHVYLEDDDDCDGNNDNANIYRPSASYREVLQ